MHSMIENKLMTQIQSIKILIDAYLEYQQDIVNMIHSRFAGHLDRTKVEDIFSNTFVDTYEKIQYGKMDIDKVGLSLRAYLYKSCFFQACKKIERNKEIRMPEYTQGELAGSIDEEQLARLTGIVNIQINTEETINACDEAECNHALSTALENMKEPCRKILTQHYWDGFSYELIAQQLKKKTSAVKMQAKRCKDSFINHNKHILDLCRR